MESVSVGAFGTSLFSIDPTGFSVVALMDMLTYVKYMNISYSDLLNNMFENQSPEGIAALLFKGLSQNLTASAPEATIPYNFAVRGLKSNFITNFGQNLFLFVAILAIAGFLILLDRVTRRWQDVNKKIRKVKNIMVWNFFIMLYVSTFPAVILYALNRIPDR